MTTIRNQNREWLHRGRVAGISALVSVVVATALLDALIPAHDHRQNVRPTVVVVKGTAVPVEAISRDTAVSTSSESSHTTDDAYGSGRYPSGGLQPWVTAEGLLVENGSQ